MGWTMGIAMALLIAYCLSVPFAEGAEIDLDVIALIESSGGHDTTAYNVNRAYVGKYQIGQAVLDEINHFKKTEYTKHDLLNDETSKYIASWYFERITFYLQHYELPNTVANMCIAYNWGIGNLVKYNKGLKTLPSETRNYLTRYDEYSRVKRDLTTATQQNGA